MLHPELELLLEIQDLHTLRRDIAAPGYIETTGLAESAEEYAQQLNERIAEREALLTPRVRTSYQKISKRHDRVVAPVLNGVCYGCFVQVPTSRGRDRERNVELRSCESCGRFIYYTD